MRERLRNRPALLAVGALVFFTCYASIVTFPYIKDPVHITIAPLGGDVDNSIAFYEALVGSHANPFFATNVPWIGYPTGPANNVGVDRVSFLSVTLLWVGTRVLGAIAAHSLLSFLGLILTAFFTFWLVWRATRSALAGVVAGFIFGFSPIAVALAGSNMVYVNMWILLIPLWAFWRLVTQQAARNWVVIAAMSVVPGVFWTPYFMLHSLVVGASCLAVAGYYILRQKGRERALLTAFVIGLCWALLLFVYRFIGLHSPSTVVPSRTMAEIYQQSAQPLMFLLPGLWSWGIHDGNSLLVHLLPRARGLNLYVGLSTLALAGSGLVLLTRRRPKKSAPGSPVPDARVAAMMAGMAAVACVAFSLPPVYHFGPLKLPTPNYLVATAVPALRAGQRFDMPLVGCLAVLAGIGAWLLLCRLAPKWRPVAAAGMLIVIGLDLWALPPGWVTTIPRYHSLLAIRNQPSAPVAWFEKNSLVIGLPQVPCLLQEQYNKPLVNDCGLGYTPQYGLMLSRPLCEQITQLAAKGTRYVVLTRNDDQKVRQCLTGSGLAKATLSQDSTYQVIQLR
jgi:hypothetical protein